MVTAGSDNFGVEQLISFPEKFFKRKWANKYQLHIRFSLSAFPANAQQQIAFFYDKLVHFIPLARLYDVNYLFLDFTNCDFEAVPGLERRDRGFIPDNSAKILPHCIIVALIVVTFFIASDFMRIATYLVFWGLDSEQFGLYFLGLTIYPPTIRKKLEK